MRNGLLMVYTGNGKSKTTAALGQVFRALGRGFKVCVIQFIKSSENYGELVTEEQFKGLLEFHVMEKGFTSKNLEEDIKAAKEAWKFAREVIESGEFQMVVLDELTYPMKYGMLDSDEVLTVLTGRPDSMTVIITGRDAPQVLIDGADLVTEVADVRHHYSAGTDAQKGVEF